MIIKDHKENNQQEDNQKIVEKCLKHENIETKLNGQLHQPTLYHQIIYFMIFFMVNFW